MKSTETFGLRLGPIGRRNAHAMRYQPERERRKKEEEEEEEEEERRKKREERRRGRRNGLCSKQHQQVKSLMVNWYNGVK